LPNFTQKIVPVCGQPFLHIRAPNPVASAPVSAAIQFNNLGIELAVFTDR
jgi:hypothetical protein